MSFKIVSLENETDVMLYDTQTCQLLAVIRCETKCSADNILAVLEHAEEIGDITSIFDD